MLQSSRRYASAYHCALSTVPGSVDRRCRRRAASGNEPAAIVDTHLTQSLALLGPAARRSSSRPSARRADCSTRASRDDRLRRDDREPARARTAWSRSRTSGRRRRPSRGGTARAPTGGARSRSAFRCSRLGDPSAAAQTVTPRRRVPRRPATTRRDRCAPSSHPAGTRRGRAGRRSTSTFGHPRSSRCASDGVADERVAQRRAKQPDRVDAVET